MSSIKTFKVNFINESFAILLKAEETDIVNGTERYSKDFMTFNVIFCCISLLVNISMVLVCYRKHKSFMTSLIAFDCLVIRSIYCLSFKHHLLQMNILQSLIGTTFQSPVRVVRYFKGIKQENSSHLLTKSR